MKKTFDAVIFMRKRREELSRAYAGLIAEEIEKHMEQTPKDNLCGCNAHENEPRQLRGRR